MRARDRRAGGAGPLDPGGIDADAGARRRPARRRRRCRSARSSSARRSPRTRGTAPRSLAGTTKTRHPRRGARRPGGALERAGDDPRRPRYAELERRRSRRAATPSWRGVEPTPRTTHARIRVARSPGSRRPESLTLLAGATTPTSTVDAGMTADGEAIVVFTRGRAGQRARVIDRAPGAPFGAARTLATARVRRLARARGRAGRARAGRSARRRLDVFERPPGGDFAAPQKVFDGAVERRPAIALRPDGARGDRVAASGTTSRAPRSGAAAPGPFGPRRSASSCRSRGAGDYARLRRLDQPGDVPFELRRPRGRARRRRPRARRVADRRERVRRSPRLPGRSSEAPLLGSPLRDPLGLTPLVARRRHARARLVGQPGQLRDGAQHRACTTRSRARRTRPRRPQPEVTVGAPRGRALRPGAGARAAGPLQRGLRPARARCPGARRARTSIATLARAGNARGCASGRARPAIAPRARPAAGHVRYGRAGRARRRARTTVARAPHAPARPAAPADPQPARPPRSATTSRCAGTPTSRPATRTTSSRHAHARPATTRTATPVVGVPRASRGRHLRVRLKDAARVRYVTVELIQSPGDSGRTRDHPRRIGSAHAAVKRVTTEHQRPAQQPRADAADAAAPPRPQPGRARAHARALPRDGHRAAVRARAGGDGRAAAPTTPPTSAGARSAARRCRSRWPPTPRTPSGSTSGTATCAARSATCSGTIVADQWAASDVDDHPQSTASTWRSRLTAAALAEAGVARESRDRRRRRAGRAGRRRATAPCTPRASCRAGTRSSPRRSSSAGSGCRSRSRTTPTRARWASTSSAPAAAWPT